MASRFALRRRFSRRYTSSAPAIIEYLEDRSLLSVVTFAVNSTADTVDANPGDGIAADASGKTSLRAAVMEANALNNADGVQIRLQRGDYGLTLAGTGEDNAATGDLDIKSKVIIVGVSSQNTSVNGNSLDRVFHVLPGANLDLRRIRVSGGSTTDADPLGGGGIVSDQATLSITDSIVSGNQAAGHIEDFGGGGISIQGGSAVINRSVIRDNSLIKNADTENASSRFGAGLYAHAANVSVLSSTFNNNTGHEGAGIANIGGGTMNLRFVNIFGNTSDLEGGGIQNEFSTLVISDSRIANNSAPVTGAGLFNYAGTVTMTRVAVVGNNSTGTGGGIWNSGRADQATGSITIIASIIRNNTANVGGGVGNSRDSHLTIRDTVIANNAATQNGGGISNQFVEGFGPGVVSLLRTTVFGNTASQSGGGLFATGNTTNIVSSIFVKNTADSGGGLANIDSGVMDVKNSIVSVNSATTNGGGILNQNARLTLSRVAVNLNTAGGAGSGLYSSGGNVTINAGINPDRVTARKIRNGIFDIS